MKKKKKTYRYIKRVKTRKVTEWAFLWILRWSTPKKSLVTPFLLIQTRLYKLHIVIWKRSLNANGQRSAFLHIVTHSIEKSDQIWFLQCLFYALIPLQFINLTGVNVTGLLRSLHSQMILLDLDKPVEDRQMFVCQYLLVNYGRFKREQ